MTSEFRLSPGTGRGSCPVAVPRCQVLTVLEYVPCVPESSAQHSSKRRLAVKYDRKPLHTAGSCRLIPIGIASGPTSGYSSGEHRASVRATSDIRGHHDSHDD
jgi:hypothetical protein